MAFVVSPGIGTALRAHMDKRRVTVKIIAKGINLSPSTTHSIITKNTGAPEHIFDRLLAILPKPWMRSYCKLTERPAVGWPIVKAKSKQREVDKNVFRRIATPHLDAFTGVPGGWC